MFKSDDEREKAITKSKMRVFNKLLDQQHLVYFSSLISMDKDKFEKEVNSGGYEDDLELIMELRHVRNRSLKVQKQSLTSIYYWITISPENHHTAEDLIKLCTRLGNKKSVDGIYYNLEWGKSGENIHTHILLRQNVAKAYSDSALRSNTFNTFKSILSRPHRPEYDVYALKEKPDKILQKWFYLNGQKEPEKMPAVHSDIQIRQEHGYEHIYNVGNDWIQDFKELL